MSVSTTTDRVTYTGDASTTAFSFPYVLFADADLKVYLKNNTTGAETLKTITTHYTISGTLTNGVYESGVTVTFLTAPTASETVLIYRDRSVTQDLELDENGKIPSLSLEKQLDKLTTDIQRVKNKLSRSVALKEGFTASFTPDLPAIMVNDGYLKTNTAGDGFEYIEEQDLINTINTSASSFTASRALVSDANGLADVSAVTATELGYLSGVTGQLSGNAQAATLTNKTIDADSNTITNIENADIKAGANIAHNKMAALTANRAVVTDANGVVSVTATTDTQIGYLSGATSAISGNSQSATLQNKTLDNSNIITVRDDRFTLQDNADTTKQAVLDLSGITTGTTRTLTMFDGDLILGGTRSTSKTGNYTLVSSTDDIVYCDATSAAFTITFPSASLNNNKIFIVKKTDSSFNAVTLSGTGMTTNYLMTVGEAVAFQSNGTSWIQLWRKTDTDWISFTPTGSWNTNVTYSGYWRRCGDSIEVQYQLSATGQPNVGNLTINIPNSSGWTINTSKLINGTEVKNLGQITIVDLGTSAYHGILAYNNTTSFVPILSITSTSYMTGTAFDRSVPMAWASGDVFYCKTTSIPITNFSS